MRKIALMRIPKTASTSVFEALQVGRWAVDFPNGNQEDFDRYMSCDMDRLDLVSGHLQAPHLLMRDLSDWRLVTVLRDPIEREISTYRYIRSWPDHPLYETFKGCTFEQFFEKTADARNLQCRFFCGAPDAERAMEAIKAHFTFVGVTEYMSWTVSALEALTGQPVELGRANETKSGEVVELSDDYRQHLRGELAEDYRLYDSVWPCFFSSELLDPSLPVAL